MLVIFLLATAWQHVAFMIRNNSEGLDAHHDVLYSLSYQAFCIFIKLIVSLVVYVTFLGDENFSSTLGLVSLLADLGKALDVDDFCCHSS